MPSIVEVQYEMAARRRAPGETIEEEAEETRKGKGEGKGNTDIDRETIYLAIVTTDSTVVYYKLSKGIKKPADIPDE